MSIQVKSSQHSKERHTRAFVRQFLRNPVKTGAIMPSSSFLTESMLQNIAPEKVRCYVEYGPGSGSFTHQAHQVFTSMKRTILFEINPFFISLMSKQYPKAEVCQGPSELKSPLDRQVDLVVSGLPFTNIPLDVSTRTIDEIFKMLKPGGSFRTFLYAHTFYLPKNIELRDYIKSTFNGQVSYRFVGRNVPPAVVIEAFTSKKSK